MNISRINAFLREQEGMTSATRADIEAMQLRKLNDLLSREKQRGGFYSNLPEQLKSLEELAALPFTTDEDLAHNAGALLLTSQSEIQRVLSDATSGTTGTAKRVFYTEKDCRNTVELFMAGLGEFVFSGSKTMICMPFSGPFGLGDLIAQAITNLGATPLKTGIFKTYGELKAILESDQPDTYVGMPAQLLGMLRYCGKGSLQRALVSGDACPESVIAGCEQLLGTKLFPHYGSREMGLGGAICCPAHEGMHLRENNVIAEIVDENGNVLSCGSYGELVITTIGMEAMPLIRYKTGDFTRILPGRCPCGSEVIRLDSVQRKGGNAAILALDNALFALDGLIDYVAESDRNTMQITALSDGSLTESVLRQQAESVIADKEILLRIRKAEDDDLPLYRGKRNIVKK